MLILMKVIFLMLQIHFKTFWPPLNLNVFGSNLKKALLMSFEIEKKTRISGFENIWKINRTLMGMQTHQFTLIFKDEYDGVSENLLRWNLTTSGQHPDLPKSGSEDHFLLH